MQCQWYMCRRDSPEPNKTRVWVVLIWCGWSIQRTTDYTMANSTQDWKKFNLLAALHKKQHLSGCFCQSGDSKPRVSTHQHRVLKENVESFAGCLRFNKKFQIFSARFTRRCSKLGASNFVFFFCDFDGIRLCFRHITARIQEACCSPRGALA